jgi:hypothetical protein
MMPARDAPAGEELDASKSTHQAHGIISPKGPLQTLECYLSDGIYRDRGDITAVDRVLRPSCQLQQSCLKLRQIVQQRLCRFEISGREPFGKPVVDWLEECRRIGGTAAIAQQPGKACGGTQFQGQSTLPPRPIKRLPEMILGRGRCAGCSLRKQKLSPDA